MVEDIALEKENKYRRKRIVLHPMNEAALFESEINN